MQLNRIRNEISIIRTNVPKALVEMQRYLNYDLDYPYPWRIEFPEEWHAEPESKAEGLVLDNYKLPQERDLTVRTKFNQHMHIL